MEQDKDDGLVFHLKEVAKIPYVDTNIYEHNIHIEKGVYDQVINLLDTLLAEYEEEMVVVLYDLAGNIVIADFF